MDESERPAQMSRWQSDAATAAKRRPGDAVRGSTISVQPLDEKIAENTKGMIKNFERIAKSLN